jgi:membrane protein YdbS with pleckstrin-like domain
MQLDNRDKMAIARSRVQRGKFMIWLLGFGLVWMIAIFIGLFMCEHIGSLLIWVLGSVVAFVIGMVVVMVYIEARAKQLFEKLKKEE